MAKIGRNDPCPCGSGKKYKKCCGKESPSMPLPRVVTSDGEEMVFLEAYYDCSDQAEAIRCLTSADDFDLESDESTSVNNFRVGFTWLERGESSGPLGGRPRKMPNFLAVSNGSRLLGNITLKRDRLILRTQGKNRLKFGKYRLESLLAGIIRHRLDTAQSLESTMRAAEQAKTETLKSPPVIPVGDTRFAPLAEGETLQQAIERREFGSLEEINLFADMVMQAYNKRPQADMAGLSPVQVRQLLDADWEDKNGPLRFNRSLNPRAVANTPFLYNVRLLVNQCESEGGAKITKAGNLNRKTVAALIPHLHFINNRLIEIEIQRRSVFNEQDIWFLHLTRVVAELAGLLRKYKGYLIPTKRGLQLMKDDKLPELFNRLFLTTFRKFNLGYRGRVGHPDIQSTMAYSLHVLGKLPSEAWHDTEEHMAAILLPAVRDHLFNTITREHVQTIMKASVNNWILDPLSRFGLVEIKEGEFFQIGAFRTTPLFHQYITFWL
jgi:hypothetical protein